MIGGRISWSESDERNLQTIRRIHKLILKLGGKPDAIAIATIREKAEEKFYTYRTIHCVDNIWDRSQGYICIKKEKNGEKVNYFTRKESFKRKFGAIKKR